LLWDRGPDCLGAISDFVWDPNTNTFTAVNLEDQTEVRDLFCSDQTVLANGDVLVAGGHDCTSTTYIGTAIANLFDPSTNTWTFLPALIPGAGLRRHPLAVRRRRRLRLVHRPFAQCKPPGRGGRSA